MPGVRLGKALPIDLDIDLGIDLCRQVGSTVQTPSDLIATANRCSWFRADTGVTSASSRVSAWADQWSNGNFAQATGAQQPLLELTGIAGLPTVSNDDGGRDMFVNPFTSGIAIGSRPYMWLFVKADTVASKTALAISQNSGNGTPRMSISSNGTEWQFSANDRVTQSSITPIAADTTARLLEVGMTTGGANSGVVSGTGYSGTALAPTSVATIQTMHLFGFNGLSTNGLVCKVAEIVISRNEPSLETRQLMRLYFANRYGSI